MENEKVIEKIMALSPRDEDCCKEYCEDCMYCEVCRTLSKVVQILEEEGKTYEN